MLKVKILKIYEGFITNSSSVNFLIASREELTENSLYLHIRDYLTGTPTKAAEKLWRNIRYDVKAELEPSELRFYEYIDWDGEFHYYPGDLYTDDYEAYFLFGQMVEKEDFKLYIGLIEQYAPWEKEKLRKLKEK